MACIVPLYLFSFTRTVAHRSHCRAMLHYRTLKYQYTWVKEPAWRIPFDELKEFIQDSNCEGDILMPNKEAVLAWRV